MQKIVLTLLVFWLVLFDAHASLAEYIDCTTDNIFQVVKSIKEKDNNAILRISEQIDLKGGILSLPHNSQVLMKGGAFSNGLIVGNNTILTAGSYQIFQNNLIIEGSWCVEHAYAEWFGSCGQGDDTEFVQKCLNTFFQCKLLNRTYHVSTITMPNDSKLEGSGQGRYQISTIEQDKRYKGDLITTGNRAYSGVIITGLRLTGGNINNTAIRVTVPYSMIDGVICDQFKGNGINLKDRAWGTIINNCGVYGDMASAKSRAPLVAITVNTDGGLITINNCIINYYEVGISIEKGVRVSVSGSNISECSINHFKRPDSCIKITGGESIDIFDNYIENFCTGIYLQSGKLISVHDNYINGLSVASFGIDIKGPVENIEIRNNHIYIGYTGSWAIALRTSKINKQKIKVYMNDLDERKLYNMNGISITQ